MVAVDDPDRPEDPEFHRCSLPATSLQARWCSGSHGSCNRPGRTLETGTPGTTPQGERHAARQVKLIEGVFSQDQKQEMITRLTETMVDIEGEAMRPVTWVLVEELNSGEWGIGGKGLTTQDVKDLQASRQVSRQNVEPA